MISTTLLGTPVYSSRQMTTALAPRAGGGWNFISQSYEYPENRPTEWFVINLENGTYTRTEGENGVYSNTNFQYPSANTIITSDNQFRAPNGRIFFLQGNGLSNESTVKMSYYDPTDAAIHKMTDVVDGVQANADHFLYNGVFNRTGSLLYVGSQAAIGKKPIVVSVDPSTLAQNVIGRVGVAASSSPRYAYYLAVDTGATPYLYVAVGQDPWELVAINLNTLAQTVLYTTTGPAQQFMQFDAQTNGWRVTIIDNGVNTKYWLADATLSAWPGSGAPPSGARTVTPYSNPLTTPPQIDWSRGIGSVLWRANGSSGPWTEVKYNAVYISPINIESVVRLADGSIFGNTEQYNGFWRFNNSFKWNGQWVGGLSQPAHCVVGSKNYVCGYPNGTLYEYSPGNPWSLPTNPLLLGNYEASTMKYAYFLRHASGVLYCAGRRERDGLGSGLGSYTIATTTFAGTNTGLDFYNPRGFVVTNSKLVFSGVIISNPGGVGTPPTSAEIIIFNTSLVEQNRFVVKTGVTDAGVLFTTSDPNVVFGVSEGGGMYRMNITTGAVTWVAIAGTIDTRTCTQKQDGTVWVVVSGNLVQLNPETLTVVSSEALDIQPDLMVWRNNALYMTNGPELRLMGELVSRNPFHFITRPIHR